MQEVSDKLNKDPDEDPSIDDIRKFLDAFIQYQEFLNKLSISLDEIKSKLLNELKEQGIESWIQLISATKLVGKR